MAESLYVKEILEELSRNARDVRDEELRAAAQEVLRARRVFAAGTGRSGCAAQAFCNRLMHLGRTAFFVFDVTTPPIREGDLLFIVSGSGASSSPISMAEKAKKAGARVLTLTVHPEAPVSAMADCIVAIPGGTKKDGIKGGGQIMGDAFEEMSWIVCDAMVHMMREELGISKEEMTARHANLD